MMRNRFHRRNTSPTKYLSATFKNKRGVGSQLIVTLDDALAVIERKNKSKEAIAFRDKDAPKRGLASMRHLQTMADLQARRNTKRGKVKMPQFSIQKSEIE